jgi:DNA-binding transcriptional ArsR family regulator
MTQARGSALASPVRREIIRVLRDSGPQPAEALAGRFSLRRPTVSEHLRVLRDAGMVTEQRHGRHRIYQLQPQPFLELRGWLAPYEQFWRERLADFAALMDEEAGRTDGEAALADREAEAK